MKKIIACVNHRVNPHLPSCGARGSELIACQLELALEKKGIAIKLERVYCLGRCEQGPNIRLIPGGRFFFGVKAEDIPEILAQVEEFLPDRI
jgi:(2Fe-2S) ferredoxin